ncbi:unnamed protein product [Hymenolepis diminuta]|uniref:Uncharacterized protein n=1 Tax=Hymenolepis diminuta TaxID=6216 RepID=A0A564XV84_HYMDI|nr:unnamed protein product [Hymenolepis diminuta]
MQECVVEEELAYGAGEMDWTGLDRACALGKCDVVKAVVILFRWCGCRSAELSNRGYQHNPHQSGGRCSTGYTFRNGRCERSAHVTQSPTQFPTPQHKEDQNKYYPNWNRNTQYGRVSSKDTHVVVATPFANKNTCKCRQLYHSRNQRKCGKLRNLNDPESLKRQFQGRDRSIGTRR